jgi:uncharacterized protein (TIGR02246 family)
MNTRALLALTMAPSLLLLAACTSTPHTQRESVAEIEAAHAKAVAAFNSCNRADFLATYSERFSFTTSNTRSAYTSPDALAQYLAAACAQTPSPQITVNAQSVRIIGALALFTGQYNFRVVNQGKLININQNFTAVAQRESGSWRVVAHHVSLAP